MKPGARSILCPHRAFAILGVTMTMTGSFARCQEDAADLHLLFRCELEGVLGQLTPSPRHPYCSKSSHCAHHRESPTSPTWPK